MPRFQPRTKTEGISCYVMSKSHVKTFIDTLYTKGIYDQIQTMLYGDGAGNILSLKWFYGVRPHISTTRSSKVTLGNLTLDKVVSPIFEGDFVQVYLGYINVPREYGDYRDYVNVRYQAYIPMVGVIDLDPAEVVGKDLHLLYTVNLTDGSAVVTLAVSSYTEEVSLPCRRRVTGTTLRRLSSHRPSPTATRSHSTQRLSATLRFSSVRWSRVL